MGVSSLMENEMIEMEPSGRVLPLFRGDYLDNVVYENPDIVLYNNSSYVAKTTTIGNPPPTDALSDDNWQMVAKGIIDADVSASIVRFSENESESMENIESGETLDIGFGKIRKALTLLFGHYAKKATASILGHIKLSNSAAITKPGEYALDAIEKNATIEGTLAHIIDSRNNDLTNSINQLNSNLAGKLNNKGFYTAQGIDGSGISINDMTAPGIYRFYVNPNTDNANYLGWTARTLLICTGDCAGYVHQIFYSNWGHCVFRRNEIQGILTFDYNLPLYHIDAKSEIAELNSRIAALEKLIKSNA